MLRTGEDSLELRQVGILVGSVGVKFTCEGAKARRTRAHLSRVLVSRDMYCRHS